MTVQLYIDSRRARSNKFLYMDFYACNYNTYKVAITNAEFKTKDGQQYSVILSISSLLVYSAGTPRFVTAISMKFFNKEDLARAFKYMIYYGSRIVIHIYTNQSDKSAIYNGNSINKNLYSNQYANLLVIDFLTYGFTITNLYDLVYSVTLNGFAPNSVTSIKLLLITNKVNLFYNNHKTNYEGNKKTTLAYISLKDLLEQLNILLAGVDGIVATIKANTNNFSINKLTQSFEEKILFSILYVKLFLQQYKKYATKLYVATSLTRVLRDNFNYTLSQEVIYPYFAYATSGTTKAFIVDSQYPKDETIVFSKNKEANDILLMSYGMNILLQHLRTTLARQYLKEALENAKSNVDNQAAIDDQFLKNSTLLNYYVLNAVQLLQITVLGINLLAIGGCFTFNSGDFFIDDMIFMIKLILHIINPGKWVTKIVANGHKI